IALNGGDVSPVHALHDAAVVGLGPAGEVVDHHVTGPVVPCHPLTGRLSGPHQSTTGGGTDREFYARLVEYPGHIHGAPGICAPADLPAIIPGVVADVVGTGRALLDPDLPPGDL